MKDYDKLLKEISKNENFKIIRARKKTHFKVKHRDGSFYISHPGEMGFLPLKRWYNKLKIL